MIQSLFDRAALEVCRRLEIWLPEIGGPKWWQFYVYDQLSISQQRVLLSTEGRLDELDAAGLLRVLARNWGELSNHKTITGIKKSGFKFVKEVQDIRNELAHKKINQVIDQKDFIRYLDTLSRLIQEISGDPILIKDLNAAWDNAIKGGIDVTDIVEPIDDFQQPTKPIKVDSLTDKSISINSGVSEEGANVLISPAITESIKSKLKHSTYVGIDFGTSTTVVTVVGLETSSGKLKLILWLIINLLKNE